MSFKMHLSPVNDSLKSWFKHTRPTFRVGFKSIGVVSRMMAKSYPESTFPNHLGWTMKSDASMYCSPSYTWVSCLPASTKMLVAPSVQWAAVRTQLGDMRDPPHEPSPATKTKVTHCAKTNSCVCLFRKFLQNAEIHY